jgi:hypothetical protein
MHILFRTTRWAGHVTRMRTLIGKHKEKRPFQRLGIARPIIMLKIKLVPSIYQYDNQ